MSIAGAVRGVSTRPGETAFTRIRGAISSAATSVSIANPAFAAQYGPKPTPT